MTLRHIARLIAIAFIVFTASIAWMFLGEVISHRTYSAGRSLDGQVAALWGGPQEQRQPRVLLCTAEEQRRPLTLTSTRAEVELDLDYRRKGLLWYSTYRARVDAAYTVRNNEEQDGKATFLFYLPARGAVYDDFQLLANGEPVETLASPEEKDGPSIQVETDLPAGEEAVFEVRYLTQGLDTWKYVFGGSSQIRDFQLLVRTDFDGVDFPSSAMSPTFKEQTAEGWQLEWSFTNLVGGRDIAVSLPQRLNPGPLAARISRFAPVSLVFFFGALYFLYLLKGIPLHPVHFAFLAASFFSFHLLLAYLVDHLDIFLSFGIASAVSVFLVVTYLRLVVSPRFAFLQAGSLQVLYLVLFSFAHFFEGWTGLTVTIGAIVTLFVVMQMTARVDWEAVFSRSAPPAPATGPEA